MEFAIYTNLLKYVHIIGFTPDEKMEKLVVLKELQFNDYVRIRATKDDEILYVFLVNGNTFMSKSANFKKLLNTIHENGVHITLVSQNGLKPNIKKILDKYTTKILKLNDLRHSHFQIDVRDNVMVPKHYLCSNEEAKHIMKTNAIENILSFPFIKQTDPQVIWTGGIPGQLIKIIRQDVTGENVYYRIIV